MATDAYQIFEAFPEAVLLDAEGTVAFCNPAARKLFPDLEEGGPCPAALAGLGPGEHTVTELPGGPRSVTVDCRPEGRLLVLRPGAEGAVTLHVLAGQLRDALAGALSSAQLMAPVVEGLDRADSRRYLAMLNRNLYRTLRLVQNMELTGRLEEERLEAQAIDLAGFCRSLTLVVSDLAKEGGMSFQYEEEVSSLITTGDEALLRRMLLGLISNGLKAAGPGGQAGLKLSLAGRDRVMLTVWNGSAEAESNLPEDFFTRRRTDEIPLPGEGAGLSLPIIRRVVSLHGGTIVVDSGAGRGLRVVVTLPIKKPVDVGLHTPRRPVSGGISQTLVELSDVLPWQAFLHLSREH